MARLTDNQLKRASCRCVAWLKKHGEAVLPYNDLRYIALAHGHTFYGFMGQVFHEMMQRRGLIEYIDENCRRFRLTELGKQEREALALRGRQPVVATLVRGGVGLDADRHRAVCIGLHGLALCPQRIALERR